MLECDKCDAWFHGECILYTCKQCTQKEEEEEADYYKKILKDKDEDRSKLKELLNKKIKSLQDEVSKQKTSREDGGDKIQQQKTVIILLREEKSRLNNEKKQEEAKVRILTKEKNDLQISYDKLTKKTKEMRWMKL